MLPFCLEKRAVLWPEQYKNPAVPNPYRTDLFFCWLPRNPCPLCLENRATSLLQTLLQKMETSPSLALSQSLNLSKKE
jgi:hypothetical protein